MTLGSNRRLAALAATAVALLASLCQAGAQTTFHPPAPLRIGVGGDYPEGLDGLLVSRGLPHERVFPWELGSSEVLKRYQLLLLSCPVATQGSLDGALVEWIRAGGRAYVEIWAGLQGPCPLQELVTFAGGAPAPCDTLPSGIDHPATAGLDPKAPINLFHLQGYFIRPRQPDQAKVLAQFCPRGGGSPFETGAAILSLPLGKGELIYSGAPLSFCLFHRGPTTERLMSGIVSYLGEGRAVPRLAVGAAEPPSAPAPQPATPQPDDGGRLPPGFELIDCPPDGPYNVSADVTAVAPGGGDRPSALLLDARLDAGGKLTRPCLWLTVTRDSVELRVGKTPGSPLLASARWQLSAQPADLLVQRRPGTVAVVLGEEALLRARTDVKPGGKVALSSGCVACANTSCQPVGEAVFGDDFMRQPGDPSPWTTLSGTWYAVGVGNEKQSVNGFYFRGVGTDTALAGAGSTWWEDYSCGVAARLEDGLTCGVCALRRGKGDYVAFVGDSASKSSPAFRLVQVRGGVETTLAERPGALTPGQWYRLALRLRDGNLEGLVDGEAVLAIRHREPRGGGIALLVRGGSARFDDVLVQPSSEPLELPHSEGSPAPEVPTTLGPEDGLTWANPAAAWTASGERPSLLWHTGGFGAEVTVTLQVAPVSEAAVRRLVLAPTPAAPEQDWLSVTARLVPGAPQASLVFAPPGGKSVERHVALGRGGTLQLARRGDATAVLWNGAVLFRANRTAALRRVGLEVEGPPVPTQTIQVRAPRVRDYVFGVAPTDWWASAGTWEIASRWACDPRWSWFAGWGDGDLAIWNKRPVEGDVVLDYTVGVKMEAPGGPETVRCRDLNAVLCGDKSDPRSGYSFIMGGDGGVKTQLLRRGVVVAECPDLRVPAGWGIHHEWFHVRIARTGHHLEMDFEGRPVFRYEDPEPLPGGYLGLWSRNSGMLIPRVTVYQ